MDYPRRPEPRSYSVVALRMILRALWLVLATIVVSFWGSSVQADAPWPPRPADLFEENIDVLYAHPIFDDAHLTLYLYRDGQWQAYPYPSEFDAASIEKANLTGRGLQAFERPDGTWLILQNAQRKYPHLYDTSWTLDPVSGLFQRIDPPCGTDEPAMTTWALQEPVFFTAQGRVTSPWVYAEENGKTVLCSMLTGEKSIVLPGDVITHSLITGGPLLPDISSDVKTVVFMTYVDRRPPWHNIYTYDLETQATTQLGTLYLWWSEYVHFWEWIDQRRFLVVVTATGEYQWRNLYFGDTRKPGSLVLAMKRFRFWPAYLTAPPRLEDMGAVRMDGFSPRPCSLKIYDINTGRYAEYTTGNLCDFGILIPDGSYSCLPIQCVPG